MQTIDSSLLGATGCFNKGTGFVITAASGLARFAFVWSRQNPGKPQLTCGRSSLAVGLSSRPVPLPRRLTVFSNSTSPPRIATAFGPISRSVDIVGLRPRSGATPVVLLEERRRGWLSRETAAVDIPKVLLLISSPYERLSCSCWSTFNYFAGAMPIWPLQPSAHKEGYRRHRISPGFHGRTQWSFLPGRIELSDFDQFR
ncbi:hypothetical protein J3F83DRAFT_314570 [Trichoderma novae-zelandiae]